MEDRPIRSGSRQEHLLSPRIVAGGFGLNPYSLHPHHVAVNPVVVAVVVHLRFDGLGLFVLGWSF